MNFKLWMEQNNPQLEKLVASLKAQYPLEDLWAWENPEYIEVGMIKVQRDHRGRGTGTLVMQAIQNYAKSVGKPVVVRPEPDRGKKAALDRFYKNLGFVNNKGRNQDYRLSTPFAKTKYWRP